MHRRGNEMKDMAYIRFVTDGNGWSNHVKEVRFDGVDIFNVKGDFDKSFDLGVLKGYSERIFSSQENGMIKWCETLGGNNYVFVAGGVVFEVDDYVGEFNAEIQYVALLLRSGLVKGVLCSSEWQKINLVKNFGMRIDKVFVVGFPVASSIIDRYKTGEVDDKLVLCPGRFDPEKVFPLYVHALYPLVEEGYRVIFTTNVKREEMERFDPQMVRFTSSVVKRGMEVYFSLPMNDYYSLLSKAGAVVIRGFADTFNVVAMEAAYLGRRVVCPNIPPYDELFKAGLFSAFDEKQMLGIVRGVGGAVLRSEDWYMDYKVMRRQFDLVRKLNER